MQDRIPNGTPIFPLATRLASTTPSPPPDGYALFLRCVEMAGNTFDKRLDIGVIRNVVSHKVKIVDGCVNSADKTCCNQQDKENYRHQTVAQSLHWTI